VTYATFALMLAIIGYSIFNLAYDYDPITISNVTLDKTEYYPGETVSVSMHVIKRADKSCRVTRQLVNGILYSLPTYTSSMPMGVYRTVDTSSSIPTGLPPGIYHLVVTLEYDYPPFRVVTYQFETPRFTVMPP
jgi:hypothetical protein